MYSTKKITGGYVDDTELYEFQGPGLNYHGIYPSELVRDGMQAEAIARMLVKAYNAGREAKEAQIREVLGIRHSPWGGSF